MAEENTMQQIYQHAPDMVARQIAGEMILVPIRQNIGDLEGVYTLNETATRVWALLDGERKLAEISGVLVEEYEVEAAQAEADLLELMAELEEVNAVVKK